MHIGQVVKDTVRGCTETNSWQRGEPPGSRVRRQSQWAGKERLPERLSPGGRWMRWEFHFNTAATQRETLRFVLTGKSSVWTPKPAALYQILTIWGLIINLNLKCGESLMGFPRFSMARSIISDIFALKSERRIELKYRRILPTNTSYVTGGYEPSCCWMGLTSWHKPLSLMRWKCAVDSASSCFLTLVLCRIWVRVDKEHWNDSQMEDANRGWILVWWSSPSEIIYLRAVRPTQWNRLFAGVQK